MKKEKKKPQRLHKLVIKLTEPIKMDQEIEMGQLALFLGANDSGKTFMLKLSYALSMTGMAKDGPSPIMEAAQFVFDNTFTKQNLNGSVTGVYTEGSVHVELENGKVTHVELKDLDNPVPMIFMSTDMRTFDQMNLYLMMRKECGTDKIIMVQKMLKAYRLYDFTYMESLISRCPIPLGKQMMASMKTFDFKEDIASIEADLEECVFNAVMEDGSKKDLSTYGKGHQSVLNMFLGVGA